MVGSTVAVGATGAAAQQTDTDQVEPADEIYVEEDGDAVVIYRDNGSTSDGHAEFGVDVGADMVYLFLTQPLEERSDATGEFTAVFDGSTLAANGSLTAPKPNGLQDLLLNVSEVTSDRNSRFDAVLESSFDRSGSAAVLQSASVSANVSTTPSELTSTGQLEAQSQLPLGADQRVAFTITENNGTYTVDAAENRTVDTPADWDTLANATTTLEEQFGAGTFGGIASVSVTVDSYAFNESTGRLDIEYTVVYRNAKSTVTLLIENQLASDSELDINASEAERIADEFGELTVREISAEYETSNGTVSASYRVDVTGYDDAALAALDVAEAAETAGTSAGLERVRAQLEARQAADLRQQLNLSGTYEVADEETASVTAEIRSRTTNWAAYVDELEDRGIDVSETSLDLSARTTDGDIEVDASASISDGLTNPGFNSTGDLDPEERALLEGFRDANLESSRLSVGVNETDLTVESAAQFENLSALRDALASVGSVPQSLQSAVGRTDEDGTETVVRIDDAVDSDPSESDVRALAFVDDSTQVNMPGQWDRDFPESETGRATDVLGESADLVSPSVANAVLDRQRVEAGTTADRTLTVDVFGVSDDGETDTVTLRFPEVVTLDSVGDVTVTDGTGGTVAVERVDRNGNTVTVEVSPDSSAGVRDLTVEADVTITAPDAGGTTGEISVDVADSDGGQDSTTAALTVASEPIDPVDQYRNDAGIVDAQGLLDAAADFRNGEIDAQTLLDVAAAFRAES